MFSLHRGIVVPTLYYPTHLNLAYILAMHRNKTNKRRSGARCGNLQKPKFRSFHRNKWREVDRLKSHYQKNVRLRGGELRRVTWKFNKHCVYEKYDSSCLELIRTYEQVRGVFRAVWDTSGTATAAHLFLWRLTGYTTKADFTLGRGSWTTP